MRQSPLDACIQTCKQQTGIETAFPRGLHFNAQFEVYEGKTGDMPALYSSLQHDDMRKALPTVHSAEVIVLKGATDGGDQVDEDLSS